MRRGCGELLHTRQPLGERPMSWQNPVPCVSDRGGRRSVRQNPKRVGVFTQILRIRPNLYMQIRIAREEQALLAVSAAIHVSDSRRMSHLKLWPVTDHSIDELRLVNS